MNENKCVSCGVIIPEGRMVCPECENRNATQNKRIKVKLNTFNDVAEFVRMATSCIGEVLAYSKNYIVSAKSIMGMYSIDLSNQIEVEFKGAISEETEEEIKKFTVEE